VLFAFDDRALPFQRGLGLNLIGYTPAGQGGDVVLPPGPAGAPDVNGTYYYGSVLEVGDELWMWYLGRGPQNQFRVCLAKSRDGRKWTRPNLGLVEHGGSRDNNLIDLGGQTFPVVECVVIHDPEDPDPARRYKMAFETNHYRLRLAVATSADGVRWKEAPHNPVGGRIEPSGLIKWRGAYYVNGQGTESHWTPHGKEARVLSTYMSYDFETWTQIPALGFRRDALPPRAPNAGGENDGPQVHLGASLWHRGNVILGFYGMWHGSPTNDSNLVPMDAGLVLSHDALHYHEPRPDFRIIEGRGVNNVRGSPTATRAPAVAHGQGFVNRGDRTLVWFSAWANPMAGIRLATWERDRLGFLQPWPGSRTLPPCLISAPVATHRSPVEIHVNAGGLADLNRLRVSVLDERFRPLPGYDASDCTSPTGSGSRQRVTWGPRVRVDAPGPIRLRVDFEGPLAEELKLYGLYVTPAR